MRMLGLNADVMLNFQFGCQFIGKSLPPDDKLQLHTNFSSIFEFEVCTIVLSQSEFPFPLESGSLSFV
jgi:hypothetical protein